MVDPLPSRLPAGTGPRQPARRRLRVAASAPDLPSVPDLPQLPDFPGLPDLTGTGFTLAGGARHGARRRTWLDTFDWRLYRAGLTLEQVTGRGTAEFRLTGRDGALIAAEQVTPGPGRLPRWPRQAAALPPGPLAERLAPVTGVRALLPVARATSAVRELRALNADAKTVARITAEQLSATYPAPAQLLLRLTVTAVRGYQAPAARLASLLAARPDAPAAGPAALEAILASAGRQAGDYSGRADVQLSGGRPAATAVASVLSTLLDTLEANVPGTVADIDTEFLHDLRIAVRRTRTVLKLAGQVLPDPARRQFRPEFKWLGDLTTPTRDLDVYLLQLPEMTAGLVGADPADLAPLREHLTRQRGRAQRELARGLRSARFRHLARDWREVLDDVLAGGGRARPAAGVLAARSIAAAHQRLLASGAQITAASPPERLHDLRKLGKELRYLLEIFASLHPPAAAWRAVRELKSLQDCLGEFQDTDVQRATIRAFAAQMVAQRLAPAPTLLAMGEVAAGLARRQQRARAEFSGLFTEFASPASQARIRALTQPAGA